MNETEYNMKIISMYLPQFHRTIENDTWWGTGYTDWEAVKSAEHLFPGHNQPRKPLDGNYYDLLDKKTMIWQSQLMKQYSVFGQCFYHYWFKDGKRVLDKPAENLLKWKDIDMPFCLCWANEPWVRSWSAIVNSNIWAPRFEKAGKSDGTEGILLEQDYGVEEQWKAHFHYLLPFLSDERYITIEGKPVFIFFSPDDIVCLEDMIDLWRTLAVENGLPGIYIIGGNTQRIRNMDALYIHITGSMFPPSFYKYEDGVKTIQYETVWNFIIDLAASETKGTFVGGIVDFDTTARKGKSGVAIVDACPDVYARGLKKLLAINIEHGVPFTFINAWNEWGEGMYLEPDERYGAGFLEATKTAILDVSNEKQNTTEDKTNNELLSFYKQRMNQYKSYWRLMDRWMQKKEAGISLSTSLERRGFRMIAIYGAGILGKHLVNDLSNSDVKIQFYIDARKTGSVDGIRVITPQSSFLNIDAIVVSVIYEFDAIKRKLSRNDMVPVVSLEELVFDSGY